MKYVFSIISLFIFASSLVVLAVPTKVSATCLVTAKSLGENKWEICLTPSDNFYDTGIRFAQGDTLNIQPSGDPTNSRYLIIQFNNNESSSMGNKISLEDQVLKLRNGSPNRTVGFGTLTVEVTKIPAGTQTPTNANTQPLPNRDVEVPQFKNPTGLQYAASLMARLIQIILSTIGVIAVVVIVIAGFRLVLQGESESARTSAKNSIQWAILGLIFALLSMGIVSIIQRLIQP